LRQCFFVKKLEFNIPVLGKEISSTIPTEDGSRQRFYSTEPGKILSTYFFKIPPSMSVLRLLVHVSDVNGKKMFNDLEMTII